MAVLNFKDFSKYFVNKETYGTSDMTKTGGTRLVYKCEWDSGTIPWTVVKNVSGQHSERIMLDHIKGQLDADTTDASKHDQDKSSRFFHLQIYLSYSPCSTFSTELIQFVEKFEEQLDVKVSICFSTFYNHTEEANWIGLLKLCNFNTVMMDKEHEICMSIFYGPKSWLQFCDDMNVKGKKTRSKWMETATDITRLLREQADRRLFRLLQGPKNLVMDPKLQEKNCAQRFASGFLDSYYCNKKCGHNYQCFGCVQPETPGQIIQKKHFCPHCQDELSEQLKLKLQIEV